MRTTQSWIQSAAREWVIARLFETGDDLVLDVVVDVPRWFIGYELGFKPGYGPTLRYTAEHLGEINRAHREELERVDAPKKRRRLTAARRQREWQELVRRVAVDRARERVERRQSRARQRAC